MSPSTDAARMPSWPVLAPVATMMDLMRCSLSRRVSFTWAAMLLAAAWETCASWSLLLAAWSGGGGCCWCMRGGSKTADEVPCSGLATPMEPESAEMLSCA